MNTHCMAHAAAYADPFIEQDPAPQTNVPRRPATLHSRQATVVALPAN